MPRVTVWVTDHFISQRVGAALKTGFGDDALVALATTVTPEHIAQTPLHIGYGILRGMERVAELAEAAGKDWFLLDLGYTNPGHFHGNYRVGFKGTQSRFDARYLGDAAPAPTPYKEGGAYALICPPTDFVATYFSLNDAAWCSEAEALAKRFALPPKLRRKGDLEKLDEALANAACVITFNSAVGWQALQKGIPAFSDVTRSTVGSWHGEKGQMSLAALKALSREELFSFMNAHQLSLLNIQKGLINPILKRYSGHI